MLFSDDGEQWGPVPPWAQWFLQLGYGWRRESAHRQICIVSSPCDSPAAALTALGLMRRRLEVPDAGDLASHLARLRKLYTTAKARTVLRRVNNKKRFCFASADADGTLWAYVAGRMDQRIQIVEEFAYDWHVDGEPPLQLTRAVPMAEHPVLRALFDGSTPVLKENLSRTDSAVCLAGRAAGESQTQNLLSAVRFRSDSESTSLGSLLTIHGWHEGRVSRVSYFNSRTRELDRSARLPLTVSADGATAFARVHADSRFADADLIAVVPRTSDPDQLESLAQQMASLTQWYTPQEFSPDLADGIPAGLTALLLRKD